MNTDGAYGQGNCCRKPALFDGGVAVCPQAARIHAATLLCVCLILCGCAHAEAVAPNAQSPDAIIQAAHQSAPLGTAGVREPVASGTSVYSENGVTVDSSNAALGYVMVKSEPNAQRLKARVGSGGVLYNYDLPSDDTYHVFPLSQGDGDYTVRVLEQTAGDRYSPICQVQMAVTLLNAYEPFLYPNDYVNFTADASAVQKAASLTEGVEGMAERAELLYAFVAGNVTYDYEKAANVQAGYLPDADETLASGRGICFDYAALLSVMLRAQGIPTKLVVGSIQPENQLHAWNKVYLGGDWKQYDATMAAVNVARSESDYIGEREY